MKWPRNILNINLIYRHLSGCRQSSNAEWITVAYFFRSSSAVGSCFTFLTIFKSSFLHLFMTNRNTWTCSKGFFICFPIRFTLMYFTLTLFCGERIHTSGEMLSWTLVAHLMYLIGRISAIFHGIPKRISYVQPVAAQISLYLCDSIFSALFITTCHKYLADTSFER